MIYDVQRWKWSTLSPQPADEGGWVKAADAEAHEKAAEAMAWAAGDRAGRQQAIRDCIAAVEAIPGDGGLLMTLSRHDVFTALRALLEGEGK